MYIQYIANKNGPYKTEEVNISIFHVSINSKNVFDKSIVFWDAILRRSIFKTIW